MDSAVVVAGIAAITVMIVVIAASSVALRARSMSPEKRCRKAILGLSIDRDRRLWAAGSIGIVGAGSQFGCGGGCGAGCGGGCGGYGG